MKLRSLLHVSLVCGAFLGQTEAAVHQIPSQYTTIQAGIDAASSGDTVLVASGIYAGTGNVNLMFGSKELVFVSQGGRDSTVIDCNDQDKGITLSNQTASTVIDGFTIKRASSYGIDMHNSSAVIRNCIIAGGDGGDGVGLKIGSGSPTLFNCIISGNAGGHGGGLQLSGGSASLTNCTIARNYASSKGGGIKVKNGGTLTMTQCVVWGNCTDGSGGPQLDVDSGATINFICSLYDSSGIEGSGTVNADSSTIYTDPLFCQIPVCDANPTASGQYVLLPGSPCLPANNACGLLMGGAGEIVGPCEIVSENILRVPADYVTIQTAIDASVNGDTVLVADGTYSGIGNKDLDFGGRSLVVMSVNGADWTIIDCESLGGAITFNSGESDSAVFQGFWIRNSGNDGAITVDNGSSPTIKDCTVSGGQRAIKVFGGSPVFIGCLLFGNSESSGAAIEMSSGSTALMVNCTLTANQADGGGAVRLRGGGTTLSLVRSILWDNCADGDGDDVKGDTNTSLVVTCSLYDPSTVNAKVIVVDTLTTTADPGFCSPRSCTLAPHSRGFYSLGSDSPCLPENNFCGLLMGASGLAQEACVDYLKVPSEFETIQAALDFAIPGDTVLVADGTYTGAGNKDLDFGGIDIVLQSENGPASTIIDCEGVGRGIEFSSGETSAAVLQGFTIRNGFVLGRGGGIFIENSSPTIRECVVVGNVAHKGGGIEVDGLAGTALIVDCVVAGNSVDSWGGGIGTDNDAAPSITNCVVTGNHADGDGGGVFGHSKGHPILTNCTVSGNDADEGGGVGSRASGGMTLINSVVWGNCAVTSGDEVRAESGTIDISCSVVDSSGVFEGTDGVVTIAASTVFTDPQFCAPELCSSAPTALGDYRVAVGSSPLPARNSCLSLFGSLGPCGSFYMPSDFPTIQSALDLAASGDTVFVAPGIYTGPGNRDLDFGGKDLIVVAVGGPDSVTIDCQGVGRGFVLQSGESSAALLQGFTITGAASGGILCDGSSPRIQDCVLVANNTTGRGGGIEIVGGSPLVLDCAIQGNVAGIVGGGIATRAGGFPVITNCLVTGNAAATGGGGVSAQSSLMQLVGCTVSGNKSTAGGGGIQVKPNASLVAERTIVWGNCGPGEDIFTEGQSSLVSFTCSVVDSPRVNGPGAVDYVCDNLFTSPLFCSPASCVSAPTATGTYSLSQLSLCLPENSPCGQLIGARGQGCSPVVKTWTGNGDGTSWEDSLNWSGGVPGTGDNVLIPDVAPTTEVLFSSGTVSIASIQCDESFRLVGDTLAVNGSSIFRSTFALSDSGALGGSGEVSFSKHLAWTGGRMIGTGVSIINDTLTVSGANPKALRGGRELNNFGQILWTGGGPLRNSDSTRIVNQFCGTVSITGPRSLDHINGVGNPVILLNEGRINHQGSGPTIMEAAFDNTRGILDIRSGPMRFTESFAGYAGGKLAGGTYLLQDTLQFVGANIETCAAVVVLDGLASEIMDDLLGNGLDSLAVNLAEGSFTITNGRDFTSLGGVDNSGSIIVGSGSDLTVNGVYTQSTGLTNVQTSTSTLVAVSLGVSGGVVSGSGTITAPFVNGGVLRPGSSPGTLTIDSDFINEPGAEIEIEMAGITEGLHDFLLINGDAQLGGTLRVIPVRDSTGVLFEPAENDSFPALSAAAITGNFDEIVGFSIDPDTLFSRHPSSPDTMMIRVDKIHTRFVGVDGGSWFNPNNWSTGYPDAAQDVFVACGIHVNLDGEAAARSICILPDSGSLKVDMGTLVANDLCILTDSTTLAAGDFQVDGDAVVKLKSLFLGPGVEPDWRSGTIEIDSLFVKEAGDLLIGQASGASRFVLKNGAVADVPGVLQVGGVSGTDIGEVVIDGTASLNVGKLLIGGVGPGTLTLSNGGSLTTVPGVIATPKVIVCDSGTLNGDGTIIGDVDNGGILNPGGPEAVGTLSILGNYTQQCNEPGFPITAGVFEVDVGNLPLGRFDVVNVSGGAILDGVLRVNILKSDYLTGDPPTIMTYFAKVGTLDVESPTSMPAQISTTEITLLIPSTGIPGGALPAVYRLYHNAPNPFRAQTVIAFDLPEAAEVLIRIYDINGRLVTTLLDNMPFGAGRHSIPWAGYDRFGRPAASGVYFYRLQAGSFTKTQRMVLVK